jgi:nitric oxide reductase activation protein
MSERAPTLNLEWQEKLVAKAWRWWKRQRAQEVPTHVARWQDVAPRLQTLAGVIAGRPVLLRAAERAGGVRGRVLLLPETLAIGVDPEQNQAALRMRVVLTAAMTTDPVPDQLPQADDDLARLRHLDAVGRALCRLRVELPGFAASWQPLADAVLQQRAAAAPVRGRCQWLEQLAAELLSGGSLAPLAELTPRLLALPVVGERPLAVPLWGDALDIREQQVADAAMAALLRQSEAADGTERAAPPKDNLRRTMLEKTDEIEPLPMHLFEKVETLDTFKGGQRKIDGDDELDDHLDALDELDLREIVRGGRDVHSVYKLEMHGLGGVPDASDVAEPGGIAYDEWDHKLRAYRKDWVHVFAGEHIHEDAAWAREAERRLAVQIRTLERRLRQDRNQRRQLSRQLDGPEIDIDAVVDDFAQRQSGHAGDDRLYCQSLQRNREVATTVVVDVSLSADSWMEGHRVLDLSRDAVAVLGEVAWRLGDALQVLAFASNTRHDCRVWEVKGWNDPWPQASARLGGLTPRGYTRIGPAIRHAAAGLLRTSAHRRVLVLLTDAKPTDFDRYEGQHGLQDVRQAVREAARSGLDVHALCIARDQAAVLPAMFGAGRFGLVRHPEALPEALAAVYRRHAAS